MVAIKLESIVILGRMFRTIKILGRMFRLFVLFETFYPKLQCSLVLLLPQVNTSTASVWPQTKLGKGSLLLISCDLTHEHDTYFFNISQIIYPIIIFHL